MNETVTCEECGRVGPADVIGICGGELGTFASGGGEQSYICTDVICPECRGRVEEVEEDYIGFETEYKGYD